MEWSSNSSVNSTARTLFQETKESTMDWDSFKKQKTPDTTVDAPFQESVEKESPTVSVSHIKNLIDNMEKQKQTRNSSSAPSDWLANKGNGNRPRSNSMSDKNGGQKWFVKANNENRSRSNSRPFPEYIKTNESKPNQNDAKSWRVKMDNDNRPRTRSSSMIPANKAKLPSTKSTYDRNPNKSAQIDPSHSNKDEALEIRHSISSAPPTISQASTPARVQSIPMNKVTEMRKVLLEFEQIQHNDSKTGGNESSKNSSKKRAVIDARLNKVEDIRRWLNEMENQKKRNSINSTNYTKELNLPMNRVSEMKNWLIEFERQNKEHCQKYGIQNNIEDSGYIPVRGARKETLQMNRALDNPGTFPNKIRIDPDEMPLVNERSSWLIEFEQKNKEHFEKNNMKRPPVKSGESNVTGKGVEIIIKHKDETSTSEDRAFGNEEKAFEDEHEIGGNREKNNNTLDEITSFISEKEGEQKENIKIYMPDFEKDEEKGSITVENTSLLMDSSPETEVNMSMTPMVNTNEDSDWDDTKEEMLRLGLNTSPVESHTSWQEDDVSFASTSSSNEEKEDWSEGDDSSATSTTSSCEEKDDAFCINNADIGIHVVSDDEMSLSNLSIEKEVDSEKVISEEHMVSDDETSSSNVSIEKGVDGIKKCVSENVMDEEDMCYDQNLGITITLTSSSDEELHMDRRNNMDSSITDEYTVNDLIGEDILSSCHNSLRYSTATLVQNNGSRNLLNEPVVESRKADNGDRNANKKKNKKGISKMLRVVFKIFKSSKTSKEVPAVQEKYPELVVECKKELSTEFEHGNGYLPENLNANGVDDLNTYDDADGFIISYAQDVSDTPKSMASVFARDLSPVSSCGSSSGDNSGILDYAAFATSKSTDVSQHVGWLKAVYSSPVAAENLTTTQIYK